ncbi:MAG: hypothetical protein GH144_04520 [Clostridia bacterium]|jgi:hypothetical protein|nr:hypothetical protein [Clostridia bacterium]
MREKYQRPFKVVMRAIQGKNLVVALKMIGNEMTERVRKIKKREREKETENIKNKFPAGRGKGRIFEWPI